MGRLAFATAAAVALIIAGAVVTLSFEPRSSTPATTSVGSSNSTPASSSSAYNSTASTNASSQLMPDCAEASLHPVYGADGNITLPAGKTLNLCVQLYYYSRPGSGPATVNLTSFASLESLFDSHLHSALTNFTMTYKTALGAGTPSSVQLGGPSNEDEGFLVEYQITPKPGITNGAYGLNLGADEPNPNGVEGCTTDFLVVLGNGVPNYDNVGSCIEEVASPSAGGIGPLPPYPPNTLVATSFSVSFTEG